MKKLTLIRFLFLFAFVMALSMFGVHAQDPYSTLESAAVAAPTSAIADVIPVFAAIITTMVAWVTYKWIKRAVKGA